MTNVIYYFLHCSLTTLQRLYYTIIKLKKVGILLSAFIKKFAFRRYAMNQPIIKVENLVKRYKEPVALEFLYSGGKHNLLKFLGKSVLLMSRFLPACWYIKINNMISGFSGDTMSYSNYWTYIGIEFIFFLAIFNVYLVAPKQRKNLTT